jgi:hypothetical protein
MTRGYWVSRHTTPSELPPVRDTGRSHSGISARFLPPNWGERDIFTTTRLGQNGIE